MNSCKYPLGARYMRGKRRRLPRGPIWSAVCESEEVRLLRAISPRPKSVIPERDRRPVYGFRRFFIDPKDLDEFVHCSENGIWPRIEAMGAMHPRPLDDDGCDQVRWR